MRDVYLVFENGDKKLLSVEYYFFDQTRVGDFILWENNEYPITKKVYDPEEIALYIHINAFSSEETRYIDLIKKGMKLQAVKLYKDTHGGSLKDAKDYIENLAEIFENEDTKGEENIPW